MATDLTHPDPMRLNLVLLGPPGSGKGTQAVRLAARYDIPHISTGEILRAAVRAGSPLGQQVAETLASGGLVSDGLMTELVRARLGEPDVAAGFVLDGFPRTIVQAHALDGMLAPSASRSSAIGSPPPLFVVLVAVADEAIVQRLSRRRVCASCGITQSVSADSEPHADHCPYCGGSLVRREDDEPATVRRRLATYASFSEPITSLYRARALLASVDGLQQADEVTAALCAQVDNFRGPAAGPLPGVNSQRRR